MFKILSLVSSDTVLDSNTSSSSSVVAGRWSVSIELVSIFSESSSVTFVLWDISNTVDGILIVVGGADRGGDNSDNGGDNEAEVAGNVGTSDCHGNTVVVVGCVDILETKSKK